MLCHVFKTLLLYQSPEISTFQLHTLKMAKENSICLLFLSSLLISCSGGSLVGFSYHERGDTWKVSSSQSRVFVTNHRILSTLITNSNMLVDLYLNRSQVENFITSKPSAISELKAQLVNFLPHVNIKSITASCGSECLVQNEVPLIMHALKSIHKILSDLRIDREVKVSVAFPLQFLRKLSTSQKHEIRKLLSFIKKTKSFVLIEDNIEGELSMGDHFVQTIIKSAALAASVLPCKDVPVILTIKSSIITSSIEAAQFSKRVSKYLESRSSVAKRIAALYVELHTTEDFSWKELKREKEEVFASSRREILSEFIRRKTLDNTNSPTNTVYPPTNPTPVITPSDTPTIIAVPSANPVTISPTNPAAMPVTVPSTTPVPLPPINPPNSPVPVFNPATTVPGTQPVTNPVTSYYPPPSGNVPVINPQQPPASNTNAPSIQGQSWCVAKSGAPQASIQSALDYACGMGGADCSQIQQGGSCYSPVTLQNHASFAFNSYYQKNPAPTSCDFGGAATLVNTNPSVGSCIFPSSSSSSTPMISSPTPPTQSSPTSIPPPSPTTLSPSIPTTAPPSIPTAPPTSSSGSGTGTFGYGAPPSVLNSSSPGSGTMPDFGSDSPPVVNTTSASHTLKPFTGCIVLMIPFVTARLSMRR